MKPKSKHKFKGQRGRPWHDTQKSKVCLLCLRRFEGPALVKLQEELDEEEEKRETLKCVDISHSSIGDDKDPLSDSPVKQTDNDETDETKKKKKRTLYMKFLWILSRYLGIRTRKLRNSAERGNLSLVFCEECFGVVRGLYEVYQKWEKIRLILLWRLSQIATTIRRSKANISGKLGLVLLKNLSTQMWVNKATHVDLLRKQIAIKCSAKNANVPPQIALERVSEKTVATRRSAPIHPKFKLLYPLEHMNQYLKTLIVVFALATPPREPPKPKPGPASAKKGQHPSKNEKLRKENIPPGGSSLPENIRIKKELHEGGEGEGDDHYDGGDHSPGGGSGPASPINNDDDDENRNEEEEEKGSHDTDWSMNASENDSDVDFTVSTNTTRRWNLRKRKTRSSNKENGGNEEDDDEDEGPLTLPPLRGSKPVIPESEKKFSCNLCSRKFRLERSLKRHLSDSHSFIVGIICLKCNLPFKVRKDLDMHNQRMHKRRPTNTTERIRRRRRRGKTCGPPGQPTECTVCKKMFPSKFKMMFHRKTTHKLFTKMECEICKKVLRGKYWYDKHKRSHMEKTFQCTKCERMFSTEVVLEAHLRFHEANPDWVPRKANGRPFKNGDENSEREAKYKCEFPNCGRMFRMESNLTVHKSLHSSSYKCAVCSKQFLELKLIRQHLRTQHEKEDKKFFFCIHCDKSFTIAQTYELHLKICHPTKAKLGCDADGCFEEFDDLDKLTEHIKTHLPPEHEECLVELDLTIGERKPETKSSGIQAEEVKKNDESEPTAVETPNETEVQNQETQPVPGPPTLYLCSRCKWPFVQKAYLDLHRLVHMPPDADRLFHCSPCKQIFRVIDTLQIHYNRYHGENLQPFQCKECGIKYTRKKSLFNHNCSPDKDGAQGGEARQRAPRQDKESKCFCGEEFEDWKALREHKLSKHPASRSGYRTKCKECDLRLKSGEALIQHRYDIHGVAKPYQCDVLGCASKGFTSSFKLKQHKISHQEPNIPCPRCPRMFRRKIHLQAHLKIHDQIYDHICDFCGKAFISKNSLKIHLDIHLGIKKYECKFCDKKFCRKNTKDAHERVHTGETPFICSFCGIGFKQQMSLKNHVRSIHELGHTPKKGRRKSVAVGSVDTTPSQRNSTEVNNTEAGDNKVDMKDDIPAAMASTSASGIIHEALQAAFNDINMDLGMPDEFKEETEEENSHNSKTKSTAPIVATSDAFAAVEALLNIEDETPAASRSTRATRRGSAPKNYKAMLSYGDTKKEKAKPKETKQQPKAKDLTCGFCGKEFKRQKQFQQHLDNHLNEDTSLDSQSRNHDEDMDTLSSLRTPSMDEDYHPMRTGAHNSPMFSQAALTPPTPATPTPPPQPQMSHPTPPPPINIPEPLRKKRGRPRKETTATPGSRLARIVDNVMEAATGRSSQMQTTSSGLSITPVSNPVTSCTSPQQQQQFQFQQQNHQIHHNYIQTQTHPHSSPSPHSMGSERSTPAGSPAPVQFQANAVTTASPSTPTQSYLSPFLLPNPYLIPGQDQIIQPPQMPAQMQSMTTYTSSQGRQQQFQQQQQVQQNYSNAQHGINQTQSQLSLGYSQQAQLYHQQLLQQQQRLQQQNGPQDLSKSNFSMFFANPRS